jgi:hypothetical protein
MKTCRELHCNSRTIQQPKWHGYELRWFIEKMTWQWNPIHTSTLHDHFLREVREWINTTATNGHAYVKLGLRREWTAWANRRIKYFLRKLEEAA